MKHSLETKIRAHWPIILVFFLVGTLFAANYRSDTYLTGWDNLHPEFNFLVNIKRSLFAVWQEYQGLGLLGGMGHASDLLRQVFLLILSIIVPVSLLRYVWTFLMLFTGATGAYYLIWFILKSNWKLEIRNLEFTSFLGSMFYLLNLATIQLFYAPFEAFIAHFASLPWLLYTSLLFLHEPSKRLLVFLLAIVFLTTPSAYIPTLFVVYIIALSLLSSVLFLQQRNQVFVKTISTLFFFILVINTFWLIPFAYFTLTSSQTTLAAKNNQMATEEIFLRNKEFGNVSDVMLLKGFWFNNTETDQNGNLSYMMLPWREYLANPLIASLGYVFFAVVIVGLLSGIKSKKPIPIAFAVLFLFAFTMLATAAPPFSWFNILFRKIPLFEEAFRFPSTKFLILAALTYAVFFVIGVQMIVTYVKTKKKVVTCYVLLVASLLAFSFPAFTGHLFYDRVRLQIAQEYFVLFDFFKNQDPNTRIANFPQHTFWGWNFYGWGYGGSGFLWYGIEQPILDRAFDVWSKNDENYYFELAPALYSKDVKGFEDILNKYQINWLLVDKNVVNPTAPKALFFPELEELIAKIPAIKKAAVFGNITVYKVTLKDNPQNFVFTSHDLPTVNSYQWNNNDQAYRDLGNYIAVSSQQSAVSSQYYPFRSLFSNKSQKDIAFHMKEEQGNIELVQELPSLPNQTTLTIHSLSKESIIPATLAAQKKDGKLVIELVLMTPALFLNDEKIWGEKTTQNLFIIPQKESTSLTVNINGITSIPIDTLPLTTFVTRKENNIFTLSDKEKTLAQVKITPTILKDLLPKTDKSYFSLSVKKGDILRLEIPKIEDKYLSFLPTIETAHVKNCDTIRNGSIQWEKNILSAKNATACISFYSPSLLHDQSYALFIKGKNLKGRGLHFWLLNEDEKISPIDTYLPGNKENFTADFVLPPQEPFGLGYTLFFDSMAIGQDKTVNNLEKVSMYPIPYNFITSLVLGENSQKSVVRSQKLITVSHPNESLYVVKLKPNISNLKPTLVLSQSYDAGWKAYQFASSTSRIVNYLHIFFPFFFGKELSDHVLINNWENGWALDNHSQSGGNKTIVITYLPQYLEYFGFGLLGITVLWLLLSGIRGKIRS